MRCVVHRTADAVFIGRAGTIADDGDPPGARVIVTAPIEET